MNPLPVLAIATILSVTVPAAAETVTFDHAELASLPQEFVAALTGRGSPGRWEVVEDASGEGGRALAQLSDDRTDYRFPLAIYMPTVPSDVEAVIRFKPISGSVDQAGGLAVRLQTADNYYVVRANALEGNVRFYRVKGGRREELAGKDVKVTAGDWHTLSLRAEGTRFTVSYDGKRLLEAQDDTFPAPGKIALWTKADSVTRFDRIEIKSLMDGNAKP